MDIDFQALVRTFLTESEEQLRALEQGLVSLESRPEDDGLLQTIFRAIHTLKGNAACLSFQSVAELAHGLEDPLDRLRGRKLKVTRPLVSLLLESVDALRQTVPDAAAGVEGLTAEHRALLKRLARASRSPAGAPSTTPEAHASPSPAGERPRRRRADLEAERERTLRVDVEKLDKMLNLAGEITISRGRLGRMLEGVEGRIGEALLEAHREADRLCMDLQEQVMKARMVPVGPTFRQHIRTVRDLAAAHGKLARVVLEGEDVEVDTRVIEHLRDPLTHMVRNAVDHGLEPPEARVARGKDACGTLTLRARHDAGSVVIQVGDDGAGLDRRRIAERARALGMAAAPERLPDTELLRLILEPGFSTSETVTDLSGRGVGMDVVRRNIEALRGSLSVDSPEGEGSTFTIRLPLTLAIIEGFGVGVGNETYVIPMDAVVECMALAEDGLPSGRSGIINLRGRPLPYLRLREVFGVGGAEAPSRENVVVVQQGDAKAGLAVDVLHGENQTVIKPLGPLFHGLPGICGSAILGSGRVALILDTPALLREAVRRESVALTRERRPS